MLPHIFMFIFASKRTEDVFHFSGAKSRRSDAAAAPSDDDDDAWNKEFTNPMHTHIHTPVDIRG